MTDQATARAWSIAEAKARFSELLDRVDKSGPQEISRRGRTVAVVVSLDEWERKTRRRGNLAEFFGSSPLPGSGLRAERGEDGPREIAL